MGRNHVMPYLIRIAMFTVVVTVALQARIVNVSTATQFKAAMTALQPGDTVIVQDGTYDLNTYQVISVSGTEQSPILIKAKNRGGVKFINKSFFNPKSVSYITFEGFVFESKDGTAFKLESCTHFRITRNIFRLQETTSVKWILVQDLYNGTVPVSSYNRIDHNLFENKTMPGNCITIDGFQGTPTRSSQHDRIDHNHFRNVGPRVPNEMETIRVGVSSLTNTPGYTVIEYNLFEDCDGDPEFVSIKTDEDTVRYNTFRSCQGTLCLRQTSRSYVEGNFFLGNGKAGTGGVRVYNKDNKVVGNYFVDLTGTQWDAACTITNGDVDSNSTSVSSHFRPIRTLFAFNTMVNCASYVELGFTNNGSYGKPPRENYIANNIAIASRNQMIKIHTTPLNQVWAGNIFYPTGTATLGMVATPQQIATIDPKLEFRDSLWHISAVSPAINAAQGTYDFYRYDINGQLRTDTKDIGADEFSSLPVKIWPLGASDVGPNGADMTVHTEKDTKNVFARICTIELQQNFPNPFNPETKISYQLHEAGKVRLSVFDVQGNQVASLVDTYQSSGSYHVYFSEPYTTRMAGGVYFYRLTHNNSTLVKKMILLK